MPWASKVTGINVLFLMLQFIHVFYWPEFLKKLSGPETDEMCQFLDPEADP